MPEKISARKLKSYQRAEAVARELRYQLADARHANDMNYAKLFRLLASWMKTTGKIKYDRPE